MKPSWKRYLFYASLIIVGGGLIFILVETVRVKNTGFETKTLWDWMELLIIPFVLAGGAFYLNRSEKEIERKAAEEQRKLESKIAMFRHHETVLQAYLDRMADLLLKEKLLTTKNKATREIARIQTFTVLLNLDPKRKKFVLLFLREAKLIQKSRPIIELSGVNLALAELSGSNLSDINLSGAELIGASLQNVDFRDTDLRDARLIAADLRDADLSGADLSGAVLSDVKVADEQFTTAKSLKGAIMPDGTKHE
jgi:hypothetical protein